MSSILEEMKGNIQTLQNNALRCCLNIMDPRDANVIAIHQQVNVLLFKERLILNLLLCIRNAVIENTLKTKSGDVHTRQNDGLTIHLPIPRTKIMRKMPFYWGSQIWNTLPLNIRQLNEKCAFKMYIKTAVINNTLRLKMQIFLVGLTPKIKTRNSIWRFVQYKKSGIKEQFR